MKEVKDMLRKMDQFHVKNDYIQIHVQVKTVDINAER